MLSNKEAAKAFILDLPISKFTQFSEDEKTLLISATRKIKCDQIFNLSKEIYNLLVDIRNVSNQKLNELLNLAIMSSLSQSNNNIKIAPSIYMLSAKDNAIDHQIKNELIHLNIKDQDESCYKLIYKLRHYFFLDKPVQLDCNSSLAQVPNSENKLTLNYCLQRYLKLGESSISEYLTKPFELTAEEFQLLQKAYPPIQLTDQILKNQAHFDLGLSLREIQTFIVTVVNYVTQSGKIIAFPDILPVKLKNTGYWRLLNFYTKYWLNKFIRNNEIEKIKSLFDKSQSVFNLSDLVDWHYGVNPLCAAVKLQKVAIVELFLSLSVINKDISCRQDYYGYSPLHYAVIGNNALIVDMLLNAGYDPNCKDLQNNTPMHLAAGLGKVEIVAKLLEKGGDPSLPNCFQLVPRQIAVSRNHVNVLVYFDMKGSRPKELLLNRSPSSIPTSVNNSQQTTRSTTSGQTQIPTTINQSSHQTMLSDRIRTYLKDPKFYKQPLLNLFEEVKHITNPFLTHLFKNQAGLGGHSSISFNDLLAQQEKTLLDSKNKFNLYLEELRTIAQENLSPAKQYRKILLIAQKINLEGLSSIAFAFELYRNNYLEFLICLHQEMTPLLFAITHEDVECIKTILVQEPNHSERIKYQGIHMTELDYAIATGKVSAVQIMLELAHNNPAINLGLVPVNAMLLAQERKKDIVWGVTTREYHDIDIPLVSKNNCRRIIRNLMKSLPFDMIENSVLSMFTPSEYRIIQNLQAGIDSDMVQSFSDKLLIEMAKDAEDNADFALEDVASSFEEAIINIIANSINDHTNNQSITSFAENVPQVTHVIKYPADNLKVINKLGLKSSEKSFKDGIIRFSSGDRGSAFFYSLGSVEDNVSPFHPYIMGIKITEAIKNGLLSQNDIYTAPNIAAFKANRGQASLVFMGEDLTQITVLRVYHYQDKNKDCKMYWYDYFANSKLISSYHESVSIEDEFYAGDNVIITAYRFILHLRRIKGPFESDSYYHYILKNSDNVEVLESALAALFKMQVRISKDINLQNPAVSVYRNLNSSSLPADIKNCLLNCIDKDQFETFAKLIKKIAFNPNRLCDLLHGAVQKHKFQFVKYLIDYGVPYDSHLLVCALDNLQMTFLKNERNTDTTEFNEAFTIVYQLLYEGWTDSNDPKHIKRAVSADNFYYNYDNSHTNYTERELLSIKKHLFRFDDCNIQMLLLLTTTKHLSALYQFTFDFGMFELHKNLAERLEKPPLYEEKDAAYLLTALKENSIYISTFVENLRTDSRKVKQYYYLFSHAIMQGELDMVVACYPYFKNADLYKDYPAMHLALKYKQIAVFERLWQLSDIITKNQTNILNETLLEVALVYGCDEKIINLIANEMCDKEHVLLVAIEHKNIDLVTKFIQMVDTINSLGFEKLIKYEQKRTVPLFIAVDKGNLEVVKIIMKDLIVGFEKRMQQRKTKSRERLCWIMAQSIQRSLNLTNNEIFDYLIDFVSKQISRYKKIFLELNGDHLLKEIITNGNVKHLESYFNILRKNCPQDIVAEIQYFINSTSLYLHAAIQTADMSKIKFIRDLTPDMPYVPLDKKACEIFRLVFEAADNVDMLEFLIHEGLVFPVEIANKVQLFVTALVFGCSQIVKWFFEKKLIDKDYRSELGENLLQLALKESLALEPKDQTKTIFRYGVQECLDYLCNQVGLDVNNKDADGKTLLLSLSNSGSFQEQVFSFLVDSHSTDFTVKDNEGNTVLHLLYQHGAYSLIIDKFLQQGGNINDTNKRGITAYENYTLPLKPSPFSLIIEKFKQQGAIRRPRVPADCYVMGVITCIYKDTMYVLVKDKKLFIHSDDVACGSIISAKTVKVDSSLDSIQLFIEFRGNVNKLSVKKMFVTSYSWIKMPNSYQKNSEDVFVAMNGEQNYKINRLGKLLLEIALDKKDKLPILPNNKNPIEVSSELYNETMQLARLYVDSINDFYTSIMLNDEFTESSLKHVRSSMKFFHVPYRAYILDDETYQKYKFYSPLDVAVALNKVELIENFLSKDSFSSYDKINPNPLSIAINQRNIAMINQLLSCNKKLTAEAIFSYIANIYPRIVIELEIIITLLKKIQSPQVNVNMKVKHLLETWLTKVTIDGTNSSGKDDKITDERFKAFKDQCASLLSGSSKSRPAHKNLKSVARPFVAESSNDKMEEDNNGTPAKQLSTTGFFQGKGANKRLIIDLNNHENKKQKRDGANTKHDDNSDAMDTDRQDNLGSGLK